MARWCTACAAEREGKFCPECGAQLVDNVATCACGYTLPDGAKFCPECGRSVLATAPPQAEQAEPAHNPLLCLHCHSEQDDENWRFCVVCGEKRPDPLDEAEPPTQNTAQPADKPAQAAPTASEQIKQTPKVTTASNDDADELYRIGKKFLDAHNEAEACAYFERAASLGHVDAKINLLYLKEQSSLIVNENLCASASQQKLDEKRYAEEMYNLGKKYLDEDNKDIALSYFERAATLGHVDAKINLLYIKDDNNLNDNVIFPTNKGNIHHKSDTATYSDYMEDMPIEKLERIARNSTDYNIHALLGVRIYTENQDITRALPWLRMGAEKGDYLAQAWLSNAFTNHFPLESVPFESILKYAQDGNEIVQYNIAWCYEYGLGVNASISDAIYWYFESAKQGFVHAQLKYSVKTELSDATSRQYLRNAMEQGSIEALALYSFSRILKTTKFSWNGLSGDIYIRGINMDITKLNNAIKAYGEKISYNNVLVLCDDTVFGSAEKGFMITDSMQIISNTRKCLGNILNENFKTSMKNHNIVSNNITNAIGLMVKYYREFHMQ